MSGHNVPTTGARLALLHGPTVAARLVREATVLGGALLPSGAKLYAGNGVLRAAGYLDDGSDVAAYDTTPIPTTEGGCGDPGCLGCFLDRLMGATLATEAPPTLRRVLVVRVVDGDSPADDETNEPAFPILPPDAIN